MNDFLAKEECAMVGFEESMCTDTIDVTRLLLGAHIDDFVITCANQQALDAFRAHLLDAFEGTCEGALQHYLGLLPLQHYLDNTTCEVTRDMDKITKHLSQTHQAGEILRTYNFWNATPHLTPA
jgi:hypothetical protein